jgi:hypothetical protein
MERLVWELVPAAILAMLIALFGRFERFGSNAHP